MEKAKGEGPYSHTNNSNLQLSSESKFYIYCSSHEIMNSLKQKVIFYSHCILSALYAGFICSFVQIVARVHQISVFVLRLGNSESALTITELIL